jgi:cathepsin L
MKFFIAIAIFFAAVSAISEYEYQTEFINWMRTYQRAYTTEEFGTRYSNFKNNMDFVRNFQPTTFEVELNEFADLSIDEFNARFKGLNYVYEPKFVEEIAFPDAPASIDWRDKGAVSHIKNQGQCGSCWSFSAAGSIEGQHFLSTGKMVTFSEQNLMDCSTSYGNMGCNGGLMDYAFKYVINNKGLDTETSYPYTARDGSCHYSASNSGGTISGYTDVAQGSETALVNAIGSIGPISVAIDASHQSFQLYSKGVYYEPACSSTQLDHGVLAVGYGTTGGQDYYIVKNSWGTSWGQAGYIQMARNRNNNCGIATSASYPTGAH